MTALDSSPPFTRDLHRTLHLFKMFRAEHHDPHGFYSYLAADTASLVAQYEPLEGRRILDVGGGPGYFSQVFRNAGATCCSLESELETLSAGGMPKVGALVGDGQRMPIAAGVFDICHSSNVIEHVRSPRDFLSEMLRVVRPGGLVFLAFTNWYSPFGGHDTSPWHYLGGERATRRYERKHGRPPLVRYGIDVFRLDIGQVLRWVREDERADFIDVFPRYYPAWARAIVRVPGVREVATWNLALALRRR
jgi:SAM-dependent methyltransferase